MVLAALACALVLCCNGSGDTGAVSLCQLLATHVRTCDWFATVHPRIGGLTSRQALVTPWDQQVDCTASCGPTNRKYGLVRPCPAVSVRFLRFPPLGQLPRAVCAGLFSTFCDPTSLLICPLASHLQCLGSSQYSIPTQHSFPLTRQSTYTSIALSIFRRIALLVDLPVD